MKIFSYYPHVSTLESVSEKLTLFLENPENVAKALNSPSKLYDQVIKFLESENSNWPEYFALVMILIHSPRIGLELITNDERCAVLAKNTFLVRGMVDILVKGEDLSEYISGMFPALVYIEDPESINLAMLEDYYIHGVAVTKLVKAHGTNRVAFYKMLKANNLPMRSKIPDSVKATILNDIRGKASISSDDNG